MFEYLSRKIPKYYPTMYLDGYTPAEIMTALRKSVLEKMIEPEPDKIEIISKVTIK